MTHATPFQLRPMRPSDLPQVLAVQAEAYGAAMHESADTLGSRLALSPTTCWVAVDASAAVAGYLLTHPWQVQAPPPLDTVFDALPEAPDCWYVHDLALAARTRGAGVADRLYAAALTQAQRLHLHVSALVAVQGSQGFWARFGYTPAADVSPLIATKLAGYGDGACFMTRTI